MRENSKSFLKSSDEQFNKGIELYKLQILIRLNTGKMRSEGLKIPKEKQLNVVHAESFAYQKVYNEAFSKLPPEIWLYQSVDWSNSRVVSSDDAFCFVRFDLKEALKIFPPAFDKSYELRASGDFLYSSRKLPLSFQPSKSGRPSKTNWEAIHVKIAEIIHRDNGLTKQDAFAEEIRHWYLNKFGKMISLPSIKASLKDYYQNLEIPKQS